MPFVKVNCQEELRQELESNPSFRAAYEALMAYEALLAIHASQHPKRRHRLIRKARLTGHGW